MHYLILELLLRIHKDSQGFVRIRAANLTINVIFGPQPQSDHIAVYIDSNKEMFFQN